MIGIREKALELLTTSSTDQEHSGVLNLKALFVYMAGQLEDEGIFTLLAIITEIKSVPYTDVFSAPPIVGC